MSSSMCVRRRSLSVHKKWSVSLARFDRVPNRCSIMKYQISKLSMVSQPDPIVIAPHTSPSTPHTPHSTPHPPMEGRAYDRGV
jgi:hypothetical protein